MIRKILMLLFALVLAPTTLPAQDGTTDVLIKSLAIKVKMYPGDYKSYAGLGAAYLQKGRETGDSADYELAKKALSKSLDLMSNDPAAAFAMTQMAVACMAEHQFEEAYTWAQKALAVGSGDPSPWAIAGDALADMGDYQNAAEAYSRLKLVYGSEDERQSISYQHDSRLSYLRLIAGDSQGAIQLMQGAVKTATETHMPKENIAWSNYQLGEEYFQAGDTTHAEEAYLAALQLYPGYYRALAGLAKVRSAQGSYHEAAALYDRAIAAVPYPEYAAALGDVYRALGESGKAQKEFELVEFISHLSEINQQIHNRDLAWFYADHGMKLEQAVLLARRELEVRHDVYTWDALAWALFRQGESKEAAAVMSHALSQGTRDAQLFFHAGMIYADLGDTARAQEFLHEALAINPHFHPIHAETARQTLAWLATKTGSSPVQEAANAK
ncbi:MAG: tetratricopeptide repeat protein [Silvibacterium sp.]|nr:tetratricopeptide repeat protein [Silvibacterium sp.]